MQAPQLIYTARLRLRKPGLADAEAIFATYAGDVEVTRYLSWPCHESIAATQAFLAFSEDEWRVKAVGPYLIERQTDGRLLGSTGLDVESARRAMTGYVLAKSTWGNGYATEALQAMVALAMQLELLELQAICHPQHVVSLRVLSKCGFTPAGFVDQPVVFPNMTASKVVALRYHVSLTHDPVLQMH